MEQWEYLPTYIEANAKKKEIREYLIQNIPGLKRPHRYMVEAIMPELNAYGEQGWELIHMEPVGRVAKNGRVLLGAAWRWSNVYFCVFKRRKHGTAPAVMPITETGRPAFRDGENNQIEPLPIAPRAPAPERTGE